MYEVKVFFRIIKYCFFRKEGNLKELFLLVVFLCIVFILFYFFQRLDIVKNYFERIGVCRYIFFVICLDFYRFMLVGFCFVFIIGLFFIFRKVVVVFCFLYQWRVEVFFLIKVSDMSDMRRKCIGCFLGNRFVIKGIVLEE